MKPVVLASVAALLACLALVLSTARADEATQVAGSLRFRFTLDNDYSTSAGAFDNSGALVRTLWSNVRYTTGKHEATWDGRDDDGRPVAAGSDYEIRILTHNVIHTWDGVIGNTSTDATSPTHHDAPYFFKDLVVSGDRAYFTTPAEGPVPTMRYFRLDSPQSWYARPALPMTYGATMGLIAADRERVYWAHDSSPWQHTWGKGGDQAFVMATDRDLAREIVFEAGTPTCVQKVGQQCYRDGEADCNVRSAIDIVTEVPENPATPAFEGERNNVTGIAVQADGPLLFVAHGLLAQPRIHVLDKRSGRLLASVPLAGVGRLVAGPGRDDLWAIHDSAAGRVVSLLRVGSSPEFALRIVRTLSGFDAPLAVALTPDGKQIVVADGGSSQQIKAFDAASGEERWRLGQAGGYRTNGPAVTTDKFSFNRYASIGPNVVRIEQSLLGFAPDGSFWVGDTGLSRLLKFDGARRYTDQIAFAPINYNVAIDRNDPSRVFAGHKEYSVDYRQPIERSWRLVRYFGDGLALERGYHGFVTAGFIDVATLSNGRTYGLLRGRNGVEVTEVPASGDLKRLETRLTAPVFMNADGSLYSARADRAGRVEFWRRPLTGFDDEGVPLWGREETSARVARSVRSPQVGAPGNTMERRVAQLAPNLNLLFDPVNSDDGKNQFHLAAIQSDSKQWLWSASPASGPFNLAQPDGAFDTSRPWYAGMAVTALGDQIVYNFHGEGWHGAGQANQFLHWHRDGLFIGQFGVPNLRGIPPGAAGMAGNSFSVQLAQANGATYLWHNDENSHAGLHRWHLDGVEWIRELSALGRLNNSIELQPVAASSEQPYANAAPGSLAVRANGRQGRLTWKNSAKGAIGVEVQRLQPTYVGPRFEPIALVQPDVASFIDEDPLPGEPTLYRVRAKFPDGASDYSNHVAFTARSKPVVLESQNFETAPPQLRRDAPEIEATVIADPANAGNHVLRVYARKRPGKADLNTRVVWKASASLYRALNASVGRPRGSRPDIYRVELRLRMIQSNLGRDSDVWLMADPGYDLFSTPGRRQSLVQLAKRESTKVDSNFVRVSFDFAAIANGAGADKGLQQYRAVLPPAIYIALPVRLAAEGDVIEFLVDDLSVARLDLDADGVT